MRRRTALKVLAATAALPLGIAGLRALAPLPAAAAWHGESMGGLASLTLWHEDPSFARQTLLRMQAEAARLESVFSLNLADSELARLNSAGRLGQPSPDLRRVLDAAIAVAERSGGAFDPTVQPLWALYEDHFRRHPDDRAGPPPAVLRQARRALGFRNVEVAADRVVLAEDGALTLNGIAQGYITDRIADLLRNEGFEHAMVEFGETRALGAAVDGRPFSVGLRNPAAPGTVDRTIELADLSLSVSGGYGLTFGRSAETHILDPATGHSPHGLVEVAVTAPRAMDADALSTAIYVAGEAAAPALLAGTPGARAMLTRADGLTRSL